MTEQTALRGIAYFIFWILVNLNLALDPGLDFFFLVLLGKCGNSTTNNATIASLQILKIYYVVLILACTKQILK
jgi:hypothetical protein